MFCAKMASTILIAFALAIFGAQCQAVTEIWLTDQTTSHVSNPLIPKSISLARLPFDTLVSCHIILNNGMMYELYPQAQAIPSDFITSTVYGSVAPYSPGCGVAFRNAPASLSGTYELLSLVEHTYTDSSRTLTRQRYHITFTPSEVEWPFEDQLQ